MIYNNKLKERTPMETISIIQNFFSSKGYTWKINSFESECETFSCTIFLYYNNSCVISTNGKGMTKEYSLASGWAELYERFCNGMLYIGSPLVRMKMIQNNYNKYGYFYEKNEQKLSIQNLLDIPVIQKSIVEGIFCDNTENFIKITNLIDNGNLVGVEYTNIFDPKQKLYINPVILGNVSNTTGMSAGNSFYEAFNQALSEICERIGYFYMFNHLNENLHIINIDSITNLHIKNIISKLLNLNKDIYIIDLSYNTGLPVVGVLLIDLINHHTTIDFGCFPIFDIALERCLTEIYQGLISLCDINNNLYQVPFKDIKNINEKIMADFFTNCHFFMTFPLNKLNDAIYEQNYNTLIYLTDNNTNEDIYNYYTNIIKTNNWNVYYKDNSHLEEITALSLFIDNLNITPCDNEIYNYSKQDINWNFIYNYLKNVNDLLNSFITNLYNEEKIHDLYYLCKKDHMRKNNLSYIIPFTAYLYWHSGPNNIFKSKGLFHIDDMDLELIFNGQNTNTIEPKSIEYKAISKYILLQRYYQNKNYTEKEVQDIFNKLNLNYTLEDYNNYNNNEYLFKKIYIQSYYDYYHSDEFLKIIETMER